MCATHDAATAGRKGREEEGLAQGRQAGRKGHREKVEERGRATKGWEEKPEKGREDG